MEVEDKSQSPVETMATNSAIVATQDISLVNISSKSLPPKQEDQSTDPSRLSKALQSKVADKTASSPNEAVRMALPSKTVGEDAEKLLKIAKITKSPEMSQSSEADNSLERTLDADVPASSKEREKLALNTVADKTILAAEDLEDPTLSTEGSQPPSTKRTPTITKSIRIQAAEKKDSPGEKMNEANARRQPSRSTESSDDNKAISHLPITVARAADDTHAVNSDKRQSMWQPESNTSEVSISFHRIESTACIEILAAGGLPQKYYVRTKKR